MVRELWCCLQFDKHVILSQELILPQEYFYLLSFHYNVFNSTYMYSNYLIIKKFDFLNDYQIPEGFRNKSNLTCITMVTLILNVISLVTGTLNPHSPATWSPADAQVIIQTFACLAVCVNKLEEHGFVFSLSIHCHRHTYKRFNMQIQCMYKMLCTCQFYLPPKGLPTFLILF